MGSGYNRYVECRCACGCVKKVALAALRHGKTLSCGCLSAEQASVRNRTHGMTKTRTYHSWCSAKQRCYSNTHPAYRLYGGRGIQMCERWRTSFETFLADMGERPKGRSLDRFPDMNGHYEPSNCRWATAAQQGRNTRKVRLVTHNGQTMTLTEWAQVIGMSHNTIRKRLNRGDSMEDVMTPGRLR